MIFFEIKREYADCTKELFPEIYESVKEGGTSNSLLAPSLSLSLSLSHLLSKFANSLDPEDLRRPDKPNQGQTGIPRIYVKRTSDFASDASKEYN